jgi:hypothetical protein
MSVTSSIGIHQLCRDNAQCFRELASGARSSRSFPRYAIERFFEHAERWSPVVEPALIAEARQLILTGQVPLDPNIAPNNLLSPEFLGLPA